jgi:hypothetical protein
VIKKLNIIDMNDHNVANDDIEMSETLRQRRWEVNIGTGRAPIFFSFRKKETHISVAVYK